MKYLKIKSVNKREVVATYDIWNKADDCYQGQGNFLIKNIVVHNSILANGVKRFEDLLFYNAAGHPGPMKCCWSYSKIDTEDGHDYIKNLAVDHKPIKSLKTDGRIKLTEDYVVVESGTKELFKLVMEDGRELHLTLDHKVGCREGAKIVFKAVKDVRAGDDIVCIGEIQK
jgi:intein/homing endonuclease